jgi:hypothetical protein
MVDLLAMFLLYKNEQDERAELQYQIDAIECWEDQDDDE